MGLSDTYLAARDWIADHGWIRGDFKDDQSKSVCIQGAVIMALYGDISRAQIMDCLNEMTPKECKILDNMVLRLRGVPSAATLNDDCLSSRQEAMKVLEEAAKECNE